MKTFFNQKSPTIQKTKLQPDNPTNLTKNTSKRKIEKEKPEIRGDVIKNRTRADAGGKAERRIRGFSIDFAGKDTRF